MVYCHRRVRVTAMIDREQDNDNLPNTQSVVNLTKKTSVADRNKLTFSM